ncbi:polyamine aminopropyltransferase [Parvularcula sp. IMCC14364]|uniref:polyamine aminopropyltransferase n=1 Tax=Parvularcula sp. IMCC14364 TaxID=3067902 RepID=UPI0027427012|nr:polyamine aminopropyltransferase [Parvularcula sp. IMCC14364]
MKQFEETLYDAVSQQFRIDKLYFESKTDHQHLMIFHNAQLGRVMTLDGVVQTTEADEFIYHEMMTHVPVLAHGNAKRVLIIGGGDGGILREVCRHNIDHVMQVEIDQAVVDMAKQYLPNHSAGAFDDPRLDLVIADGMEFVRSTDRTYDIIIVDSTDPIGPGEVLFTEDFYAQAKRCLADGGVMVTQNGVPFFQPDELKNTHQRLQQRFRDARFYCAPIPTYYGGFMSLGWATDDRDLCKVSAEVLRGRLDQAAFSCRYYTPEIHAASFALPQYMRDILVN